MKLVPVRLFCLAAAVGALGACATAFDGQIQDVTIETVGAEDALCTMENRDFSFRFYPPQTLKVTKSRDAFTIRCLAMGNREKTMVIEPHIAHSFLWNATTGYSLGAAVDHASNAMYELPEKIVIDFSDTQARAYSVPSYQKVLDAHPHLKGMEEFRPGKAALQRDAYDTVPVLKPRQFDEGSDFLINEPGPDMTAPEEEAVSGAEKSADDLTRAMNPKVFGPPSPDDDDSK